MKRKPLADRILKLCQNDYQLDYAYELLPALKKAVGGKNGKIYAQVNTVSNSGMSRTVSLYIVKNGEIINLNHTPFASVYGDSVKNGVVRVSGCGTDMLFECTYRLYHFLFDTRRKPYQRHLNRYTQL